jgi:DNA processing protein
MTDLDALALAVLGAPRRPLLGALVRHWLQRPLPDVDDLPARRLDEPFLAWACRCACAGGDAAAELDYVRGRAARQARDGAAAGLHVVSLLAERYPAALREIADPPPVLWARGDAAWLRAPRLVAVVGARAASRQGLEMAAAIADGLARAGVVVVSGLARGIDTAAHRAALEAGGATIAVLGSGVDRPSPAEHAPLAASIAARGAVVSEYPPGTPPLAFHFPQRNRLISGIAAATVVVEASERSGSLITAATALEQGREVMAVPGSVASGRHRGAHALLRDGATLVESAADVLVAMGWDGPAAARRDAATLDPAVAAELGLEPGTDEFGADEVCAATGWSPGRAAARLGALEIAGRIQRLPGGRFGGFRIRVLT